MVGSDKLKPRAEAAFRKVSETARSDAATKETSASAEVTPASRSRPVETTEGAMDEYKARQKAERAKMAKLKALRLAAEAKTASEPKAKRKPGAKGKQ
jgi:hypothetical protein